MDHKIAVDTWAQQWLDRTHSGLDLETVIVYLLLSATAFSLSVHTFIRVTRSHRALKSDPSDRVAIFAQTEKQTRRTTQWQWYIANVYLLHALGVWLVDAGIGTWYVWQDASANPEDYDARTWLQLATHTMGMLAIFLAVFLLFPMAQMVGMSYLVVWLRRQRNPQGTLAAYISEARILTTHLAQMWLMMGFYIVSWWPVFENPTTRLIILEAAFGSGMAWWHASYIFNFRAEAFSLVETEPLLTIRDGVKLYGQQVYAVHTGKPTTDGLPRYQDVTYAELSADEKTAL